MPAHLLAEWTAFEEVEGPMLIQDRLDVLLSQLLSVITTAYGSKPVRPKDFVPWWRQEQSPDQLKQRFEQMLNRAEAGEFAGGTDHRIARGDGENRRHPRGS